MADDVLGDRMKALEAVVKPTLTPNEVVVIRCDGKAFHTYTRSLHAHDERFMKVMWEATKALCENAMGARLGYVQSDEISVVVNPWMSEGSQAWFGNDLQKIVSVSAAIAAAQVTMHSHSVFGETRPAYFDARAFVVPRKEVNDYLVWRQLDAHRNAVNALAQDTFSKKQLHGAKLATVRQMLRSAGRPFEALPMVIQRGAVCTKQPTAAGRSAWSVLSDTPWFSEDPQFAESRCFKCQTDCS